VGCTGPAANFSGTTETPESEARCRVSAARERRMNRMSRGSSPDSDDEETAIFDSASRGRRPTQRGHETSGGHPVVKPRATPDPGEDRDAFRKRAIEITTPTAITPDAPLPIAPSSERSEPIRVISMKTPGADKREVAANPHVVKLRAISELAAVDKTPPGGMGRLAPPRDAKQVRSRRIRDVVIWSFAVLVIGAIVTVAVFLLARR
jgi:hypothetical protein